ncbi:unnamed protein product [Rhizophagus irregularis]|nr:unnamed protein product [Rhizophagus irregularis]
MLQRAFELREPLEEITAIDRELEEFTIFTDEWEIIKELCRIFEIFHKATEHMSKSNFITLSSSIPVYNVLLDHLEKLLDTNNRNFCSNLEVRNALRKGYEKLKVYYAKTDDSYVYPIVTNNNHDEDELEEYLRKPVVAFKTDPLQWWKAHEATFPHLANMARDFLAIPGKSNFF